MGIYYRPPALRLVAPGGPVTRALRALREAEALPSDLVRFPGDDAPCTLDALRAGLRRQVEADLARAERCLACLDLLDGDPEAEDGGDDEPGTDDEPSLGSLNEMAYRRSQVFWSAGDNSELEDGDDCGIADRGGQVEQVRRFMDRGGNLNLVPGIRR